MLAPTKSRISFVFYGTEYDYIDENLISPSTKCIPIHTFEFDQLLDRENDLFDESDYAQRIVFLDNGGPEHPDGPALGIDPGIDSKNWFHAINVFLGRVAKRFGDQVVIAAHPRSSEETLSWYRSAPAYRDITLQAVANSVFVIGDTSTALAYAAWYKKPVAVISHPALPNWHKLACLAFQRDLGCEIWDVTASPSTWSLPKVDKGKYEQYVREYVKLPGTPMSKFWDVVIETLAAEPHQKPAGEKSEVG